MIKFLKENITPTLIILIVSILIAFAMLPLAQAEWTDGVRADFKTHIIEEEAHNLGIFIYLAPFIKVALFLGIGIFLTILVRKLIILFSKLVSLKKGGIS